MMPYLVFARQVVKKLKGWSINQISRGKNSKADRLARLTSSREDDLRGTPVEYFLEPSVTTRSGIDIDELALGPC